MVENVGDKCVNGSVISEDSFHSAQFMLTLFDNTLISLCSHQVVFLIDRSQSIFIELEFYDTAFIINRACRAVLYRLRHIININVITEYLAGTFVFGRYRCTCKAYVCCIWQIISDDTGGSVFQFTSFGFNAFGKTILSTVSFVSHNDNISALGECFISFLKFLHSGENYAICLSSCK